MERLLANANAPQVPCTEEEPETARGRRRAPPLLALLFTTVVDNGVVLLSDARPLMTGDERFDEIVFGGVLKRSRETARGKV